MWAADNIVPANMLLYSLCCDIISLISLKITRALHLLLVLQKIKLSWDFKIRNSVQITEGSDNVDSDNRGPTVYIYIIYTIYMYIYYIYIYIIYNIYI